MRRTTSRRDNTQLARGLRYCLSIVLYLATPNAVLAQQVLPGNTEVITTASEQGQTKTLQRAPGNHIGSTTQNESATTANCDSRPTPFLDTTSNTRDADNAQYNGRTIDQVRFHQLPIFDPLQPDESHTIHKLANRFHGNTRLSTLRKQLRITSGARFDAAELAEAERRLRENRYLARVELIPHQTCDNQLVLWVFTQDNWSITPGFSYSQIDDETTVDVSLSEVNFLGLGHSTTLGYTRQEEEASARASYYAPRLFEPGIDVSLSVTRGDWIDAHWLNVEKPFLTYSTPFAFGFSHLNQQFERNLYWLAQTIFQYDYEYDRLNAYLGYSPGIADNRVQRWRWGVSRTETAFSDTISGAATPFITNRERDLVWGEYLNFSNQFTRLTNLRKIQRVEDIGRGPIWRFKFGYSDDAVIDNDLLHLDAEVHFSPVINAKHLLQNRFSVTTDWLLDEEAIENGIASASLTYFWLFRHNQRFLVELVRLQGDNLTLDRLLTQGGRTGLRGYPSSYQLGNAFYRGTLEHRYYFKRELWHIFQFATAVFVDVGRAWFTENSIEPIEVNGNDRLWNLGVGLRVASNRIGLGSIAHIDLATPMTDPPRNTSDGNIVGEAFEDWRFTFVLKSAF